MRQTWQQDFHQREQVTQTVIGQVQAGQGAVVQLMDAYMGLKLGTPILGLDPANYTIGKLRNADPNEVYQRPYGALAATLAKGTDIPFSQALQAAFDELDRLSSDDLQLAQTHAARDWMTDTPEATGWTRVASGSACGFCQEVASPDKVYRSDDLMPLHNRCTCVPEPVDDPNPKYTPIDQGIELMDSSELGQIFTGPPDLTGNR